MTKSELDELNKDGFLDWFAGFAAGEGSFTIVKQTYGGARGGNWRAQFAISLRDDDLEILLEIQEKLRMGTITRKAVSGGSNPCAQFTVCRIDDNIRLVEVFERYPLRAKKQRDFEIWKRAVREIKAGQGEGGRGIVVYATYNRELLRYLSQRLKLTRTYREGGWEAAFADEQVVTQLTFWQGA